MPLHTRCNPLKLLARRFDKPRLHADSQERAADASVALELVDI